MIKVIKTQTPNIVSPKIEAVETVEIKVESALEFKEGQKVKHKEEKISGIIKFVGVEKIAVVWEDNSRERIALDEAKDVLEYVDDIQTLIAPTTPQISRNEEEEEEINKVLEAGLNALDDEVFDDIEDGNPNPEPVIDVEKIKLQREVNDLQTKLTKKNTNNMKEKVAKDLVDVAIMKNIIEEDDRSLEMEKILMMNDEEFNEYKQSILDYEDSGHQVTSEVEDKDDLTEAERTLNKIKGNGGRGIIGDFSKQNNSSAPAMTVTASSGSGEKRSLGEVRDQKITFSNQYVAPSFEDQFSDILSSKVDARETTASAPKDLPGFENLQGLKKPLMVTADKPAVSYPTNTSLKDLFTGLEWTTLTKVH